MLISLLLRALYIFFVVLEGILFIYIISSWFPLGVKFRNILLTLVNPMLEPIRYLLKRSIFQSNLLDLSPIIAFVVITYLQQVFYGLA